jgi:hypothetical protein
MPLEKELAFFDERKEELLRHYEGQFVLVMDASLIGAFSSEADAYRAGLQRFGNTAFLIKRVSKGDDDAVVSFPALSLGLIHAGP